MTCRTSIHCDHSETCPRTNCEGHPSHPFNRWGAGRPVEPKPEPKQPDPDASYRKGLWLVYAACGLIFLIFLLAMYVSSKPSLH